MKVREIAGINEKNLAAGTKYDSFQYLDTGSITNNIIEQVQVFHRKKDLPSRARRIVQNGDILISTVRPVQCHYGYLDNPDENTIVSTGFTVLTPNTEIVNGRYLYYFLTQSKITRYFQMIAESSVSAYPSITSDIIGNVEIELPDLETQNKIAKKMESFDIRLSNNRNNISDIQLYCQLIFHKWFVDFNFPDENGKPYKDAGGEMILIEGKLIPKGWDIKTIGYYVKDTITGEWGVEEFSEGLGEMYCIRGADLPHLQIGRTNTTPKRYINYDKTIEKQLTHGDVMIEISGGSPVQSTGRVLLTRDSLLSSVDKPIYCSNFSKIIRPKKSEYGSFIGLALQRFYDKGVFFHYESKTTGIKNLLLSQVLDRVKLVVPTADYIIKFNDIIGSMYDKINYLGHENELLEETKNLMVKKFIQ